MVLFQDIWSVPMSCIWSWMRDSEHCHGNPWRVIHHIHPDAIDSNGLPIRAVSKHGKFRHDLVKYGPVYFRRFRNELGEPESIEKIPVVATTKCQRMPWILLSLLAKGMPKQLKNLLSKEESVILHHIQMWKTWLTMLILIHRDLSTFERIESIQDSWSIEETPFRRFQYIVFVPGLFHIKMACANALWRTFVEPKGAHSDQQVWWYMPVSSDHGRQAR